MLKQDLNLKAYHQRTEKSSDSKTLTRVVRRLWISSNSFTDEKMFKSLNNYFKRENDWINAHETLKNHQKNYYSWYIKYILIKYSSFQSN